MATLKSALRNIRSLLDSDPAEAVAKSRDVLGDEPHNYQARVFLGLAYDKLNRFDAAEREYETASSLRSDDPMALVGLISSYEKQGDRKLVKYDAVLRRLCTIYRDSGQPEKCLPAIEKFILLSRKNGSRTQFKKALYLHLPTSPFFDILEDKIPQPHDTYARIIEIAEAEEKEFINREIGERKTRLGARVSQVTSEVKCEAFQRGELDNLFREVINWTHDDDVRHGYEERILRRAYEYLLVLPREKKTEKRSEVVRLAKDMVIIEHPFLLAWSITLGWQDIDKFSEIEANLVHDYVKTFPEDGLSKILQGLMFTELSPFPKMKQDPEEDDTSSEDKGGEPKENDEDNANGEELETPRDQLSFNDHLLLMAEGLEQSPDSILAHRIMAEVYLALEEWQTSADVARKALKLLDNLQQDTGFRLRNARDSTNITLAYALIHHQSPRYHPEARKIFESILHREPTLTSCLLGVALILEEDQDYAEAVKFLERAPIEA